MTPAHLPLQPPSNPRRHSGRHRCAVATQPRQQGESATGAPAPLRLRRPRPGKPTARLRPRSSAAPRPRATLLSLLALAALIARPPTALPLAYAAVPPACSPEAADVTVGSAAQLSELVQQTNCSGGSFRVSWRGAVTFEEAIVVGNGTTVIITGVGSGAVLDGGGITRLVEVRPGERRAGGGRRGALILTPVIVWGGGGSRLWYVPSVVEVVPAFYCILFLSPAFFVFKEQPNDSCGGLASYLL